jgi:hypothetical protein
MPISRTIASLVLLLSLAVAGVSLGVSGVELSDLVRLLGHGPDAAIINAWPKKYCFC